MKYKFIKVDKQDHIATITLNRPEKMNALNSGLLSNFSDALDDINADHDINVVIVTGSDKAFSSGFDISPGRSHEDRPSTANWAETHMAPRVIMKLWNIRQPTISAVSGYALAAGNVLAMTADIVIAAESAVFGEPEIRHVAHSPAILLPYMIPFRHLHWLYYTGDMIDARTAEKWNMVNKVVPDGQLLDEARQVAERIARVPAFAVQTMKRSIKGTYDKMGFPDAFEHHLMLRMIEGMTPDADKEALDTIREENGMHAFLEARDNQFR